MNYRTQATRSRTVALPAERPHGGLRTAPVQMAWLVGTSMLLTVLLGSISRADVWVTVNPGGAVTRTEVNNQRNTQPEVSAQPYGTTSTRGFTPRTGPGIALEKQTWGIAQEKQTWGIAQQPQSPYTGTNIVGGTTIYSGIYPPFVPTAPIPFGNPYYPPQYYPYPQQYYPGYPAPGFYGYQPGPSRIPLGSNPNRPSAWLTHIPLGGTVYYPPAYPAYPPPVVYPCNVCHRNPCGGHHGHNHGFGHPQAYGFGYNGAGFNGSVHTSTTVSPSVGVSIGNRSARVNINSGRSTTSSTVITSNVIR